MATIKTYQVTINSAGNIISTKEIDVEKGTQVVIVLAKNATKRKQGSVGAARGMT